MVGSYWIQMPALQESRPSTMTVLPSSRNDAVHRQTMHNMSSKSSAETWLPIVPHLLVRFILRRHFLK